MPLGEETRRTAHLCYEKIFLEWFNNQTQSEQIRLRAVGLDKPLAYEPARSARRDVGENGDDEFGDPADLAVVETISDHRKPIADFESVSWEELDALCDHFGAALIWASENRPDLLKMSMHWLAILKLMRPELIDGWRVRIPQKTETRLRAALNGGDPLKTGDFFRRPLSWVRDCLTLWQLGQRGWSLIYVMRQNSVGSITNQEIGALHHKTRQAANKLIQDFKDNFSGMKNLAMRGEETRKRCQKSQIS